jgi:DNA repair ATPase RecN
MKNLEEENKRLMEVLENLVQLKRWKDKHGKDLHYYTNVKSVWQEAFEIIDTKNFTNEQQ